MSESQIETDDVLGEIDSRLKALSAAEKYLKKPSTISFAERRDLSAKATRAASTLRTLREERAASDGDAAPTVAESEAESEAEAQDTATSAPDPIRAALDEADRVLDKVGAAQPAGLVRKAAGGGKLPGQNRRGGGGMSSQQRPPDRIGE